MTDEQAAQAEQAIQANDRALALYNAGRWEEAEASARRAIDLQPAFTWAHNKLAFVLLLCGSYAEGWSEYEWRPTATMSVPLPKWKGAPIHGATLLVHAEQGLGDFIQFLRYLPLVVARSGAARVFLTCPVPLVRLVEQSGGCGAELIPMRYIEAGEPVPDFQCLVAIMSLPLALGVFPPLEMARPYLRAESIPLDAPGLRVGLVWAGNPALDLDAQRSIAFDRLRPLLDLPGVSFYSLQIGDPPRDPRVTDLTPRIADFADTAAFMASLDVIVTVDTAAAHLAGALGRPVWLLVAFPPDWRWGLAGETTPWYPTMRIFRQRTAGDWEEVIRRVADALSAFAH